VNTGVLIIGLGQIGMASDLSLDDKDYVYTHARAFEQHPAFTLLGGVDACPQRRAEFSARYSRPAFASVLEGLAACRPEVVVIAVPTDAHAAVLQEVLAVGAPRAVLCEKPLAYELAVAQTMVASCAQTNCQLFVNYVRRTDPAVREIKFRLETGQIATPVKGAVWYTKGLFHNGSHFFDLMQYWLGAMQSFRVVESGRCWGEDPEPDVAIVFGTSLVHFIAAREENYSHYTAELVSPSGRLRYDLGGERVIWQQAVASVSSPGYTVLDPQEQPLANALSRIQWHVADQLAAALRGTPVALCGGDEALRTIECLTSIKNAL
jgi:predicted dehydrogenase